MLDGTRDCISYPGLVSAQQVRWDFMRSGAQIGGVGEGVFAAGTCEMLIDGTPAVTFSFGPVRYAAGPPEVDSQTWVIQRVNILLDVNTAPLIDGFGSGNALATGCLLRLSRPEPPEAGAAETTDLVNFQANRDFQLVDQCDFRDDATNAFYNARWTPRNLVLHGRYEDTLQLLIRDDLSGYAGTMRAKVDAYVLSG